MASFDLKQCSDICFGCIKGYVSKHQLQKGETFDILCNGIPKEYIPHNLLTQLNSDPEAAIATLDPVTWAARYLDWHCLDPDGSIWKRKDEEGTLGELPRYNEELARAGKSIFHRPYQKAMLQCTSKWRVFLCGRQLGKTTVLVVIAAFYLFNFSNFHIVLIAPYDSQVENVHKRLSDLINSNPTLADSVIRDVKSPYHIVEFANGSRWSGFTAGSKSKSDATASRGQSANMLILEEADYLNPADFDASLATIINFPDAKVVISSTPTGRRERFFKACTSKLYKTFKYSSHVNPNWTEELDNFYRENLTEAGYQHEIMAEFGEQEEGVYQNRYIEVAQDGSFEYGDIPRYPDWMYTMGVDWNDTKIGTTIRVVGFNPKNSLFYTVAKYRVSKEGWTQLTACEKIVELNRLWLPSWIYVDRGYGSTQHEVLRKFGYDSLADKQKGPGHPDSRLAKIVKAYDFGGSIEVRDLFTKQLVKKSAKPFLVENSVRRFETRTIKYPKSDEHLTLALQGYIIDRISQSGMPVYKQQNESIGDHDLDALNLALVAFTLEETEFGKVKYDSRVTFASPQENHPSQIDGLTLVPEQTIDSFQAQAATHKPSASRTQMLTPENKKSIIIKPELPAANLSTGMIRPWAWPGFLRDEPKPRTRTLNQAYREAEQRIGSAPRRTAFRPVRKKF